MKKTILFLTACLALVASAVVFAYRPAHAPRPMQADTYLQHGLGIEAALATSALGVSAATTRFTNFMSYRSGIAMNSETQSKLNTFETTFQNGGIAGFTRAEIKSVVNSVWNDIFASICTSGICSGGNNTASYVASKWRSVPADGSGFVMVRPYGYPIAASSFNAFANDYKNNTSGTAGADARAATPTVLNNEVDAFLNAAGASITSWNNTTFSPTQAFITVYVVVTGDNGAGNSTELAALIQHVEDYLYTQKGIARSSSGKKAFGVDGYLYSTPADLFFSASVQNSTLDKFIALR